MIYWLEWDKKYGLGMKMVAFSIISLFLLFLVNNLQYLSCRMYTELRSPELGHGLTSQQPVQQIKNVNMGFLDKCS